MEMGASVQYWAVRMGLGISRILPEKALYALSSAIVEYSYAPGGRRHRRILEHLALAFPDATVRELEKTAEEYRRHKAAFWTETVLMLTGRIDYANSVVNLSEARERIESLKSRNDRGMLFLVSHYGNWEFLAQFFAVNGLPGTLVARPQSKNRYIDERIIRPYRRRFGHRVIERKGALRAVAKIFRERGGVGMHIDQMIPPPNGIRIDFFGHPAYASKSMAQLKLRFDPLVVPIFAVREGRKKFRVLIGDPVEYRAEELEDPEEKIRAITRRYSLILEERIRREPAQWEWYYRRWRMPEKNQSAGR